MYKRIRKYISIFILLLIMALLCSCGTEVPAIEIPDELKEAEVVEFSTIRDRKHIAGKLYLPAGKAPFPVVILCHGFGGNMKNLEHYAEILSNEGYAALIFDFIGGGKYIESDGETTEMSVLTEEADLKAVIEQLEKSEGLDMSQIYLIGASQGAFVTTCYAGDYPDQVKAMIALYPGYNMQDFVRARTNNGTDRSKTYNMSGITVGRIYVEDALSVDLDAEMRAYPGPVLIVHGDRDSIAPISYSQEAVKVFPNASLKTIAGGDHMFLRDEDDALCIGYMLEFLKGLNN